jgi:hypothetical protein
MATVKVEVTPEIQEAIDYLAPVARASEALYRCELEFGDEPNCTDACTEYQDAWFDAVERYMSRPIREEG